MIFTNKKEPIIERQIEMICAFSNGVSLKQFAASKTLSTRTLESEIAKLKELNSANSVAHLCCIAMREGIIT